MAASDMTNRRHVQLLLTWSTNAAHPKGGGGPDRSPVSTEEEMISCHIDSLPVSLRLLIQWRGGLLFPSRYPTFGAAYGTAKSGTGIASMSVMRPELIMKSIIPVIMAGIIGIYGLVISVLVANGIQSPYTLYKGFMHLGAGLSVGLSGLAAGFAIGIVGDAGVRGTAQQPRLFVGMILILIFAEVLGLYGLIVEKIVCDVSVSALLPSSDKSTSVKVTINRMTHQCSKSARGMEHDRKKENLPHWVTTPVLMFSKNFTQTNLPTWKDNPTSKWKNTISLLQVEKIVCDVSVSALLPSSDKSTSVKVTINRMTHQCRKSARGMGHDRKEENFPHWMSTPVLMLSKNFTQTNLPTWKDNPTSKWKNTISLLQINERLEMAHCVVIILVPKSVNLSRSPLKRRRRYASWQEITLRCRRMRLESVSHFHEQLSVIFSLRLRSGKILLVVLQRVGKFSDLEDALFNWFTQKRANNIIITDDLLREKAQKLGEHLDVPENFAYSSGWLQRFKGRFHISQRRLCGEGASISPAIIDEHLTNLNSILANSGYDPANICNADETGLFFQIIPDRTLAHKDENCRGVKRMKQRITVLLCCNSTGTDKRRLLIIGKSAKPRCFRNFSPHFYCTYTSNSKAWMTSSIFQEWLLQFNKQLVSEGRRILLLLDNATSHCVPNDGLSNIKIHFLPPNMTASLQPLDSGIIKSFKAQYRKIQLQKMVELADAHLPTELRLDYAVRYCKMAWNSVSPDSISNCWNYTGIIRFTSTAAVEPLKYGNLLDCIRDIFAITPENLMTDREFQLVDDSQEAEMKLTDDNFLRLPSLREARTAAETVLLFLDHSKRATSDDVNLSADLLRRAYAISEGEKTQVVITDFFKKIHIIGQLLTTLLIDTILCNNSCCSEERFSASATRTFFTERESLLTKSIVEANKQHYKHKSATVQSSLFTVTVAARGLRHRTTGQSLTCAASPARHVEEDFWAGLKLVTTLLPKPILLGLTHLNPTSMARLSDSTSAWKFVVNWFNSAIKTGRE
ncbi:hypothetical protein LAZ67_3005441 [Cordylochernes scorpioides]|uniref:HTH CENPB-type domain-containing protein n=1 Tax=Cordylochernes scorpioides TaxID=51811 RepID=A0ABY6KAG2_9ARAC|nr:hypothetical protein LAZ67_3005441 [Cordylochernes scorpioides]